jgi:hypothetical protein
MVHHEDIKKTYLSLFLDEVYPVAHTGFSEMVKILMKKSIWK